MATSAQQTTRDIRPHMDVIGADGVHVGTVDRVDGNRIKLTRNDNGQAGHVGHHHFLSLGLVADVEGDKVRLSASGANALQFLEEGTRAGIADAAPAKGSTWKKVGMGAAAIGAAGAAAGALWKWRQDGDDDLALRLETDENLRLISSEKVDGTPVYGREGDKLGSIQTVMLDKYTGRVGYAVMTFGGVMGFGASLFPVPWSLLDYDTELDGYRLGVTKEQLAEAPKFEASDTPEFDASYRRRISAAYRAA